MDSNFKQIKSNYNKHIYNEKQCANLFTFRLRGVYIFSRYKYMIKALVSEGIGKMRLFHNRQYVAMVE